jgi:hypothetical protein
MIDGQQNALKTLPEEFGVVCEGGCHHASVDIIELLIPCPWLFDVVDFKSTVHGYAVCNQKAVSYREKVSYKSG